MWLSTTKSERGLSVRYANEVGEAFRALVPVSAVWATHAVATVYVSADALDKGKKAAVEHGDNPGKRTKEEPGTCPSPPFPSSSTLSTGEWTSYWTPASVRSTVSL
eukprot:XP_013984331.1 PREDICTED: mitochondrial fission process protein 1-like [Salmo salar]